MSSDADDPGNTHDHPDNRGIWLKTWAIDLVDGDHAAALLLTQLLWWHQPSPYGWVRLRFKRAGQQWLTRADEDWWDECRLTVRQVRRIKAALRKEGLIVHKVFRIDGVTRSAWRPDIAAIQSALIAKGILNGPEFEDDPESGPGTTRSRNSEPNLRVTRSGDSHGSDANALFQKDANASLPSSLLREGSKERGYRAAPPKRSPSPIPAGFSVSDAVREWAETKAPSINPDNEIDQFCDYHRSQGTLRVDWDASFRMWIRNAVKFAEKAKARTNGHHPNQAVDALLTWSAGHEDAE